MATDYTNTYTSTYDPTQYGNDAYNRSLSAQLAASQAQRTLTGASYADLYAQAQGSALQSGALSGSGGLSGGMQSAYLGAQNASNIGALSNIYAQRDAAMGQIALQEMAAPSNAMMEAQQAKAYDLQNQQEALARVQQLQSIIGTTGYNELSSTQVAQLQALGATQEEIDAAITGTTSMSGGNIGNQAMLGINTAAQGKMLANSIQNRNIKNRAMGQFDYLDNAYMKGIAGNEAAVEKGAQTAYEKALQEAEAVGKKTKAGKLTAGAQKDAVAKAQQAQQAYLDANPIKTRKEAIIGEIDDAVKGKLDAIGVSPEKYADDVANMLDGKVTAEALRNQYGDDMVKTVFKEKKGAGIKGLFSKATTGTGDDAAKKVVSEVLDSKFTKSGFAKFAGGTAKVLGGLIGVWGVVSTVEMIAETLGVAGGAGFTGLIMQSQGYTPEQIQEFENKGWVKVLGL